MKSSLSILIYCLTTAIGAVWIAFSFSSISGFTVTFFTMFFAFLTFCFIQKIINKKKNIFWLAKEHPFKVLELNFFTLITWSFAFLALYNIEASIESALFQGGLPIGVLLCELIARKTSIKSLRTLGVTLISLSILLLIIFRFNSNDVAIKYTQSQLYLGTFLAMTGGIAAGIYAYRSSLIYSISGTTTLDILCNRFFILILVTGLIAGKEIVHIILEGSFEVQSRIIILSFISVVIPAFALQFAIEKIGPARVSLITPSIPLIALAIEQFTVGWSGFTVPVLLVITSCSLLLANSWLKK